MTKGITYFATDKDGNVYNRYSALHDEPRYFFALVRRHEGYAGPAHKSMVAYGNQPPRALIIPSYQFETIPVRAYPGRHKVEPVAAMA